MSNFYCKIKIKETGEIEKALAMDNFFGHHHFGYRLEKDKQGKTYNEDEVEVISPEDEPKQEPIEEGIRKIEEAIIYDRIAEEYPFCPDCNEPLYLCSFGGWNCPNCYKFIRKATKEELETRNNKLKKYLCQKKNQ